MLQLLLTAQVAAPRVDK